MEKLYNENGDVAVLYSPGYGAAWSTWANSEVENLCLFDPEVVQWVLDGKPENKCEYFQEKYGRYFYAGGLHDLEVFWVRPGQKFRIREYDGYESIELMEEVQWKVA